MKSETKQTGKSKTPFCCVFAGSTNILRWKKSPRVESDRIYQCKTKPVIQEHQEV